MKKLYQSNLKKETTEEKQPPSKESARSTYVTRDTILKLLSDPEIAAVTTAETLDRLPEGEEYVDMEQLDCGVLRADQKKTPMGRVLPKKSVHKATWEKIIKQLPTRPLAKTHIG